MGASYRVLARIGAGGMGEVYEAEHLRLGMRLAIKFLRSELASRSDAADRFAHEARRLAGLRSEHVVAVVDCGKSDDDVPFLVMERLAGFDLREVLERHGSIGLPRAVKIVIDAAQGLAAIHEAGLVHRDLKPANLFVTKRDDGRDWCKVLDLGIAKALTSESTARGSFVGTLSYMAPEQLREDGRIDSRTDVYALGVILYRCVAGRLPYASDAPERLIHSIINDRPASLRESGVPLPEGFEKVLLRAMARAPEERFQTASEFIRALKPFAGLGEGHTEASHASADETTADVQAIHVRDSSRGRSGPAWIAVGLAGAIVGLIAGASATTKPVTRGALMAPPIPSPADSFTPRVAGGVEALPTCVSSPAAAAPASEQERRGAPKKREPKQAKNTEQPRSTPAILFDSSSPYEGIGRNSKER